MTLKELITDLRAAGANENTIRLAMNCYELGRINEREAIEAKRQPDLEQVMSRDASRRELPAYMRSVPGVVVMGRSE